MTPSEFRSRFIKLLPAVPADLDLQLDCFVTYPPERVHTLRLPDEHKAFLSESGLPADAAPFLNFECGTRALTSQEGVADSYVIGSNNYGDSICLDVAAGGAVVYYNHDDRMKRVFMNSSLPLFAESLCAFAEFMQSKDQAAFVEQLNAIDPPACAPDAFWKVEAAGIIEE